MCVYSCPSATYMASISTISICYDCIEGCGSCIGPAIADCNSCAIGYFLIKENDKLLNCVKNCKLFNSNTYGETSS